MFLLIVGGDMRYAFLTALAARHSMEVAAIGLEKSPFALPVASLADVSKAQAILLPNPWRNGMQLPLAESSFTLEDVLSRVSPGACLLLSDTVGIPAPPTFRMIDLSLNENYLVKNAFLTAEAAIFTAYQKTERSFMDSRCLIIGYGRIGKRLAMLLRNMGANVAIIARREASRLSARSDGAAAFCLDELDRLLPQADYIFSTVPATILDESLLRLVSSESLLMDLASPPFGFDLNTALRLSLHASRENGLPGRRCPESAAAILLEAVKEALSSISKGESSCI